MTGGHRDVDPVRRHVYVAGRVQNVWFRDGCRREALAHGVTGWVRNLSDGRVEAVLEGPEAAVERVVEWCRSGPPRARVSAVEVWPELPLGEPGFTMR